MLALITDSHTIEHIWDYVTEELAIEYVKLYPMRLGFLHWQTEMICLAAVKADYRALRHVKNQTVEICREALKQNSHAKIFICRSLLAELDI
jgi:hypothetical protein